MHKFIEAVFTTAKNGSKLSICICIYIGVFSAMKINEVLKHTTTCITHGNITQSERSQTLKVTYCMIPSP